MSIYVNRFSISCTT